MQFNSFTEVLAMGGYGAYVWSSVAIVFAVLVMLIVHSCTAKNRTLRLLRIEQERADKISQAKVANAQALFDKK
jgi:heme exporter protein D